MNGTGDRLPTWRRVLYYLGIGAGIVIFSQQLWQGAQAFRQQTSFLSHPDRLVMAAGATFLAYVLQVIAWAHIMRGLGIRIGLADALQGYIVSFLPRYIPGTVWGYLSRGEWLKSQYGISYSKSSLGSALETGLILLSAVSIAVPYYLWPSGQSTLQITVIIGTALVLCLTWYGFNLIWASHISRQPHATWHSFTPVVSLGRWFGAYVIYLGMWGCYGLSLLLLLNAFTTGYGGSILDTVFAFSLSWLIGFVVLFVPSGLGVREFVLSRVLFSQSLIPADTASAVAVASRLLIYLAEIVWLILGLLIKRVGTMVYRGHNNR